MATAQNTMKKSFDWSELIFKIVLLLPAFLILGIFMFYPIVETFRISLMRASGLGEEVFIGFYNYIKLFSNEEFLAGLLHVFQWAFWSVVIQIPLAFFIAFTCTNYKTRLIKGLRGVYYLSNVLPSAITAMLGLFIFQPNSGVIVTLAKTLGWGWLERIDFLGDPKLAFWSVFALATWAYIGFGIIYFMANIEQIPAELREAAVIDGANKWQYARYIVVPQISYALRIQAILCTVGSLKLFDLPWMVTTGGPGTSTVTLGITLYREGFLNWQYGKAAAIGVIIFLLSLAFTIVQFSLQRESQN
ncbi:carbohydrate ABC transporter permease [Hydrogenispora ethanolica]|nr:sugar ABC transporter permease [Hydrogenispora ethanolica]